MEIKKNIIIQNAIACIKSKAAVLREGQERINLSGADAPVIFDLENGLYVSYVVDQGDYYEYVQSRHLAEANITKEQLHEIGLKNLIPIIESKTRIQQYGDVHGFSCDKYFEASIILHERWWNKTLRELAPNGYVVALPARNFLGVCDTKSQAGIAMLRNLAANAFAKETHPITRDLYIRRDGKWEVYN